MSSWWLNCISDNFVGDVICVLHHTPTNVNELSRWYFPVHAWTHPRLLADRKPAIGMCAEEGPCLTTLSGCFRVNTLGLPVFLVKIATGLVPEYVE